jgi:hypothetical protein
MVSIIELAVICAAVLWFTVLRDHRSERKAVVTATTAAVAVAAAPAPVTTTATTTVRKAPAPLRPPAKGARAAPRRPKAKPAKHPVAPAPAPKKTARPDVAEPKVAAPEPKATTVLHRKAVPVQGTPKPRRQAAAPALIRLSAAHGDCWLSVHRGSQSGAVLFEGTLVKGRVLTYDEAVWVRFGGASNMAVYVNGKQVHSPFGTIDTVIDRSGIHAA